MYHRKLLYMQYLIKCVYISTLVSTRSHSGTNLLARKTCQYVYESACERDDMSVREYVSKTMCLCMSMSEAIVSTCYYNPCDIPLFKRKAFIHCSAIAGIFRYDISVWYLHQQLFYPWFNRTFWIENSTTMVRVIHQIFPPIPATPIQWAPMIAA